MKKRILFAFAIAAVFALAIAAFAYNRTTVTAGDDKRPACCKKGDSCPMKGKADHNKSGEHAKGEHHKCCGDSCPMKAKGGDQNAEANSCCSCCGDSCPMKKGDTETKATAVSAADDGKGCCDDCDCCKAKQERSTV